MAEPVSNPSTPVFNEQTTFGWAVVVALVTMAFAIGGFAWRAEDTRDRTKAVEEKHEKDQGDVAEIKSDVKVLKNDMGWLRQHFEKPVARDNP